MGEAAPLPVIIDCDPGIGPGLDADDALALFVGLASPEFDVKAVTTVFGNVAVDRGTDNALRVLEAAGRTDIPVAQGMSIPLSGRLNDKERSDFAAQDVNLPPADATRLARRDPRHAVDLLIDTVMAAPGRVSIVAVGPLTNVAMAILKEPGFASAVKQMAILGGAFGYEPEFGRGNITPVAELNIWNDPLAAEIVFQSGIDIVVTNLDVSNPAKRTVLYEDQLGELLALKSSRFVDFLEMVTRTYIDSPKFTWARKGCILYDPTAIAALIRPELFTFKRADVRVQVGDGPAYGQTIAYPDSTGSTSVATDVDGPAFVEWFMTRMRSLIASV